MRLLDFAAILALEGDRRKNYKLACVIQRSDGAIVHAVNEMTKVPQPSCHAERRALLKSDWGSVLYVARVIYDGSWAIAKPCPRCQAFIRNKGVKRVYYTIGPGEWGVWDPREDKRPV